MDKEKIVDTLEIYLYFTWVFLLLQTYNWDSLQLHTILKIEILSIVINLIMNEYN